MRKEFCFASRSWRAVHRYRCYTRVSTLIASYDAFNKVTNSNLPLQRDEIADSVACEEIANVAQASLEAVQDAREAVFLDVVICMPPLQMYLVFLLFSAVASLSRRIKLVGIVAM